ncbi:Polysaccharide antigen chain regulator [Leminorella richardii]|uniref:Polysaccharide antigen chain regulator n=1 Tax=Leminorella richardii TaxID=158841 RepID=A0A2X4UYY5_9GAMM|nr:Wzz/FepE/Etk N-terminal domain-containing protein [Leminorella richardii]SQI44041.1 Polysaccharide antigen chain regulator [Leminorella richardii]
MAMDNSNILPHERYLIHRGDDIDLIELALLLWRERWWIFTSIALSLTLALGYLFITPAQWVATSYVTAPRLAGFSEYLAQRRAVSLVLGLNVTPDDVSNQLFGHFTAMARRPNEKHAYLATTDYFQAQTQGMDEKDIRRRLEQMAERELLVITPDEKRLIPYFVIEAKADSPDVARALMAGYIDHINRQVLQQDENEFQNRVEALVAARQKELADIEFSLQTQHDNQLKELNRALDVARQAGITDYYTRGSEQAGTKIELANSIHKYMLGENYLNAEINALKNSPRVYPVRYYDIQRELRILAPLLKQNATDSAHCYQFTLDASVKKSHPKSLLILMLAALLGELQAQESLCYATPLPSTIAKKTPLN